MSARRLGTLLLVLASSAWGDGFPERVAPKSEWRLFRGSLESTGQTEANLPAEPQLLWSIKTDDSFESTAAIVDGTVFLPSVMGKCYALALADGAERWKYAAPDEDPVKSSPCVWNDLVIYGDDLGTVRGLDRATGKERWKFTTQAEIICSPTVVEGKLLVGAYDNFLYALEPATGSLIWKVETSGPVHCSPTLYQGVVAVAGCDGFLRFVSIAEGKEAAPVEIGGNIASTPVVSGSRLFLGTMNESVVGIDAEKREIVWDFRDPSRSFPFYSSPALFEDLVILGGRDKGVHGLQQADGKERWVFRTKGRVDSSPVIVGGRAFVGSHDGNLYALDAKTGKKSWSYLLGGSVVASPAVADDRLVIASTEGLICCFGSK